VLEWGAEAGQLQGLWEMDALPGSSPAGAPRSCGPGARDLWQRRQQGAPEQHPALWQLQQLLPPPPPVLLDYRLLKRDMADGGDKLAAVFTAAAGTGACHTHATCVK
jgi:hypothetical protein